MSGAHITPRCRDYPWCPTPFPSLIYGANVQAHSVAHTRQVFTAGKHPQSIFCLFFWDRRILTQKSRMQGTHSYAKTHETSDPLVNLIETVSTALVHMMKKNMKSDIRVIGQEKPPERNNSRLGSWKIQKEWGKDSENKKERFSFTSAIVLVFRWTEYVNVFEPEKPYKEITFHFLRKFYYAMFKWPKLQGACKDY